MIESIITAVIVGGVSAAVSGYIAFRVLQATIKLELDHIKVCLSDHTSRFDRVLYRDSCLQCKGPADERHSEICRRIGALEESFKSCFEDLVQALRKE